MPDQIAVTAFAELFKQNLPLLDVRAPTEFSRGAFPLARNIPLLDDAERKAVGIRYKEAGQAAAIALGEELVSGDIRDQRLQLWSEFINTNPSAAIYCFRGGLRSTTVQNWLHSEGIKVATVTGGYKELRRFCINTLERISQQQKYIVIGGKTGCAKTHLLQQLSNAIDLEGNANHRGSAFGRRTSEQPNQINFENQLAIDAIKLDYDQANKIFIEDESKAIGSLSVPSTMHLQMSSSPLAIIEEPFDCRVDTILNDYIFSNYHEYKSMAPERYTELFAESLLASLMRIRRRLGEEHFADIKKIMEGALAESNLEQSTELHRSWISKLLKDYYDPMYDYQLGKKSHRIVFRGNKTEFLSWVKGIDRTV
ncbi:MAG: tRNA 2-selenouridine(34) synthase MnmH [Pseudomonadales bacterium]|nr:tRNA 2-selenouridine(34) synthase MnmH [Pseudomonadales bacterium]